MSIIPSAAPNNTSPAPLSPEREAEIRNLEQAAALGPWLNDGAEFYQAPHGYIEIDRWVGETLDIENDEQSTANAAFVAAARTAVPELLAELDRLRAELAALPAPVVEHGILTADGGAWLLDKVDDDRRKLILQYTPAMQRIVRYGEWTEVTS